LRPPLRGRAAAVGGLGLRQGPAQAGMGQTEIIGAMEDSQLLAQPVFALAQESMEMLGVTSKFR
ncbi:MAG TPA: hypothetical protein VLQ80_22505, partial [Candidatus Saccharimonadia bacterium]|nr:hypothetical protein [Candidatus Saccharimonadia bacterium]